MATGDQNDIQARIARLIPISWFESSHAIRDAIATGLANAHAYIYAFIAYVKLQTRILTATDGFLDAVAQDFFGSSILRAANQSDASFRARILINIFRERATRNAIVKVLQDLTGRTPIIIEPQRPADCGAYGGTDSITVIGTPQIYRNDWQGNQLLYPTARTNLLKYSQDLTQNVWSESNASIAAGATTGPDGVSGAAKLVENTATSSHLTRYTYAYVAGTTYTATLYLKAAERAYATFLFFDGSGNIASFQLNLLTGQVVAGGTSLSGATCTLTSLQNGWWAASITATAPIATSETYFDLRMANVWPITAVSGMSYAGDGVSGMYIFGGQLETGSIATSYIPTTTSSVTITDYALNSNGAITFSSPPAQGASLTWSGSYASAIQSQTVTVTAATFGVGDGASATFSLAPKYGFVGGYGVAGAYGSVLLPYQAFVIAYRPLGTGIPYVAGYGSAPGGYSQPSRASYADLSNSSSAISDSDIYAAIDSVKPAATILWTNISS